MMDAANENEIQQEEEVEVLKSMYGIDFHVEIGLKNSYAIDINEEDLFVSVEVTMPTGYPSMSPVTYNVCTPFLKGAQRQEFCMFLQEFINENAGRCIVYELVEKVRELVRKYVKESNHEKCETESYKADSNTSFHAGTKTSSNTSHYGSNKSSFSGASTNANASVSAFCPEILSGDFIEDRKSKFQGHIARVASEEEAKFVLSKLKENRKILEATHNIYAYRLKQPKTGLLCQDCEDDGETHAGKRLLHLLQTLNAEGVIVVVTRWYGGVHLGPDRFKHINNVARQVLVCRGFIQEGVRSSKGKKKGKK